MHMEDQGGGDGAPVAIPPQEGEEEVNSFPIAKLLRLNCPLLNYFPLLPSSLGEIRSPGSGTDSSTSRNDDSGLCYMGISDFLNSNLSLAMRAMRLLAGKGERGQ